MAWQLFFSPGAVLVGPHDGRIDHAPFVVGILGQCFEDAQPYARAAPARVAQVNDAKVAKALGQIAPGNAGSVAVEHGIDKQAVVRSRAPYVPGPAGQKVFDAIPLGIGQGISTCHAPDNEAWAEFDDTP